MTLVIPGQSDVIFDSFLVDYILKIVNSNDAYEMKLLRRIPTNGEPFLEQSQFWDIMLRRDFDGLSQCNEEMAVVSKYLFRRQSYLKSLLYSNIDYIVYPTNPDLTMLVEDMPAHKDIEEDKIIEINNANNVEVGLIDNVYIATNGTMPYIRNVTEDTSYVLTHDFYTNNSNMSLLEILTKDYLKRQTLDLDKLVSLTDKYRSWGRLEQFYYGPILMTLIKTADREVYTS